MYFFLDSTARENRLPAYERVALKKREFIININYYINIITLIKYINYYINYYININ